MSRFALCLTLLLVSYAPAAPPLGIVTTYPGHSCEEMERLVTVPEEAALKDIAGVERCSSFSVDGRSLIWLDLARKADPVRVRQRVIEILSELQLPAGATPLLLPYSGEFDLFELHGEGKRPETELRVLAEDVVGRQLRRTPGVAAATPLGGRLPRCQVTVDPTKLMALKLGIGDVANALQAATISGLGLRGPTLKMEDLQQVAVSSAAGAVVLLRDVAAVQLTGVQSERAGVALAGGGGRSVVFVLAEHRYGSKQGRELDRAVEEIRKQLPEGVRLERVSMPAEPLFASVRPAPGTELEERIKLGSRAAAKLAQVEGVTGVHWLARTEDDEVICLFDIKKATPAIEAALRSRLAELPGVETALSRRRSLLEVRPGEGKDVVLRVLGRDLDQLAKSAEQVRGWMKKQKGPVDVTLTGASKVTHTHIRLDPARLKRWGLRAADVTPVLEAAQSGIDVGQVLDGKRPVDVRVRLGKDLIPPRDLGDLPLAGLPDRPRLRVREVTTTEQVEAASAIVRVEGERCVVISCNLAGRDRKEFLAEVRKMADELIRKPLRLAIEE